MDSELRRATAKPQNVSPPAAEIENTTGNSAAAAPPPRPSTTESQLVDLLSQSRREAAELRQELAAVRRKADADHRRLQALSGSINSPDHQVRVFQERLAHAEAALAEAEARSRFVEQNWLQVERYLSAVQRQAADSRAAFTRIMEQGDVDGRLVLPGDSSPPATRREVPLRDYIASSGFRHHAASHSHHHHTPRDLSPTSPYSPRRRDDVPPRDLANIPILPTESEWRLHTPATITLTAHRTPPSALSSLIGTKPFGRRGRSIRPAFRQGQIPTSQAATRVGLRAKCAHAVSYTSPPPHAPYISRVSSPRAQTRAAPRLARAHAPAAPAPAATSIRRLRLAQPAAAIHRAPHTACSYSSSTYPSHTCPPQLANAATT
ncbi:hypothetical protein DFH06DRAFT_1309491 [Mycena polygramma]|nr:hypothetical protein DFH06DRAFT_1309491 [Mycena polygramma]